MNRKSMSLKAKIRNLAKKKHMSAQVVLQEIFARKLPLSSVEMNCKFFFGHS